MTRPTITVMLTADSEPMPIHEETRGAWNAALRASEAAVRAAARAAGITFTGDAPHCDGKPGTVGTVYTRVWHASDGSDVIRVKVERAA